MVNFDQKALAVTAFAAFFCSGQTVLATHESDLFANQSESLILGSDLTTAEIEALTGGTVVSRETAVEAPSGYGFSYLRSVFPTYPDSDLESLAPISTNTEYKDRFFGFGAYRYVRASVGTLKRSYQDENLAGQALNFDGEQTHIGARAGMMFDKHWGIEARLAHNDEMEYANVGSENAKYGFRGFAALFGRLQANLGNGFTPYLNLGPVAYHSKFETWNTGANRMNRQTSYGLGGAVGLELALPTNFVIGLDAFFVNKDAQGFGLSVGYNF